MDKHCALQSRRWETPSKSWIAPHIAGSVNRKLGSRVGQASHVKATTDTECTPIAAEKYFKSMDKTKYNTNAHRDSSTHITRMEC